MIAGLPGVLNRGAIDERADELRAHDDALVAYYQQQAPWGLTTAIDLGGCDAELIRSAAHIERFAIGLCDAIDMRRFGAPIIVRFGDDPQVCGYSLAQLIETSLISGHFAEQSNAAYIDIFSCKAYRPYAAAHYCARWFAASSVRLTVALRQATHA